MLACEQTALPVARHAVRIVGWAAKHAPCAGRLVITHDPVIRDVADEQVAAVAEPYRPLRPAHACGELLDRAGEEPIFGKARIEDLHRRIRIALVWLEVEGLCIRLTREH